jgi:hypothetical protein
LRNNRIQHLRNNKKEELKRIEEEVKKAVASGRSESYVDGMEYIKTLVLDTQGKKEDTVSQPTLL